MMALEFYKLELKNSNFFPLDLKKQTFYNLNFERLWVMLTLKN